MVLACHRRLAQSHSCALQYAVPQCAVAIWMRAPVESQDHAQQAHLFTHLDDQQVHIALMRPMLVLWQLVALSVLRAPWHLHEHPS